MKRHVALLFLVLVAVLVQPIHAEGWKNVAPSLALTYYKHFDPDYLKNLPDDRFAPPGDDPSVTLYDGKLWVYAFLEFSGDTTSLQKLGVETTRYSASNKTVEARFSLSLLPQVAAVPGVSYVNGQGASIDLAPGEQAISERAIRVSDSIRLRIVDSAIGESSLRAGIDSAIWYIDTVKDPNRPTAAPDLDLDLPQKNRVSWVLLDTTTFRVLRVMIDDTLEAGHYRVFTKSAFVDKLLAAAGYLVDKPCVFISWLRIGGKVSMKKMMRFK